jgi:HSP20 family protein
MYTFNLLRNVLEDDFFMERPRKVSSQVKRIEEGCIIEIEVPGCSEEDVTVEVLGTGNLHIKAEVRGKTIWKSYGIPSDYDKDKITAKVENGLLTVELPYMNKSKYKMRKIL